MIDPCGLLGHVVDGQLHVDALVTDGPRAAVYRARDASGGPVALECLKVRPDAELLARLRPRFWRTCHEVDALSREEPGVCRVLGSGATSSPKSGLPVLYMALEWLEGRSLEADLRARRAAGSTGRTWGEVVALFSSVASALARAHSMGLVHGEVEPANLFLPASGEPPMKLLDFGVARTLDEEGAALDTRSITQVPYYQAPEILEARRSAVGPWTDVYSFSLVVLESLRDARVRAGRTYAEIAHEVIEHKRVPTPRALGLNVTDGLEELFASALAIDPARRPKDVGELWARMRRGLGIGSVAPPAPATRRAPEPSGTVNMPSPSGLPSDVRHYLDGQPTPGSDQTVAFDDERTVNAPPAQDTLEKLPASVTPPMHGRAYADPPQTLVSSTAAVGLVPPAPAAPPAPPAQAGEPSALMVTDSALIEVEPAGGAPPNVTLALPGARGAAPAAGAPALPLARTLPLSAGPQVVLPPAAPTGAAFAPTLPAPPPPALAAAAHARPAPRVLLWAVIALLAALLIASTALAVVLLHER